MNKDGRKRIDAIMADIEKTADLRNEISELIETLNEKMSAYSNRFQDIQSSISELMDEEQEKYDNLPEGLQASDRGSNMEAGIEALNNALEACDEACQIEELIFDFDPDQIVCMLDDAKNY